jgi:hypothetical protein
METNREVRASCEHAKDKSKDGGSKFLLGATGTMDHSYTWVSGVRLAIGSSSSTEITQGFEEIITKETARESSMADPESELKLEITYFIL